MKMDEATTEDSTMNLEEKHKEREMLGSKKYAITSTLWK
jgi:hypothetical protein